MYLHLFIIFSRCNFFCYLDVRTDAMKYLFTLPLFIFLSCTVAAQNFGKSKIILQGKITELFFADSSEKALGGVQIEVWNGDKVIGEIKSTKFGKYKLEAPYKELYQIKYIQNGYVTKTVELETKSIRREEDAIRIMLTIDMSLFKENPSCDFTFLNEMPVAKAKVLRRKDNITWDTDYNKAMQERIRAEFRKIRVSKPKR